MSHDGIDALSSSEIAAMALANEARQLELQLSIRRAVAPLASRVPPLLADYLKMLSASILGFWVLTALLALVSPVTPLQSLPVLGLLFAGQATFYKYKLKTDPTFKVPSCGCGASRADHTGAVLQSDASSTAGVPNSVLAGVVYVGQLAAVSLGQRDITIALAVPAVIASAYLGYVMVFGLRSLCSICVNIAALNTLILLQVMR